MEIPDDATTAYYRSMARNMVPAIYDLFFLFGKKWNVNPLRAYMIGSFSTDDHSLVEKVESQVLELKHADNKEAIESAIDLMNTDELSKNESEYKFATSLMPIFSSSLIEEANHLGEKLTDMFMLITLVKPEGKETYMRVKIKCRTRSDWSKTVIDGGI